jgi:hypothetical protein
MPKLEVSVNQVIDLVKQLPQKDKFAVLHALNQETGTTRSEDDKSKQEEQQLRALTAKRGLDWDRLSEDDRDVLAKSLLH